MQQFRNSDGLTYFASFAERASLPTQGGSGVLIEVVSKRPNVNTLRQMLAPGEGYTDRHASALIQTPEEEFVDRRAKIVSFLDTLTDDELAEVFFDETLQAGSQDDYSDWCALVQVLYPEVLRRNFRAGLANIGSLALDQYDTLIAAGTNPSVAFDVVSYDSL